MMKLSLRASFVMAIREILGSPTAQRISDGLLNNEVEE
jgi:hypothetical protein